MQKALLSPAGDTLSELCGPGAHLLLIIRLKYKTTWMASNLSRKREKMERRQEEKRFRNELG